jgi:FkbM family methyltransferase
MTRYLVGRGVFRKQKFAVVDVGARFGGADYWNAFGDQLDLIGFEPDEDECRRLNALPGQRTHRYFPVALYGDRGRRTFYVAKSSGSSGFYKRDMAFWSRLSCKRNVEVERTVQLDAVDFDHFASANNIDHVDFMKVDVEGAELDVLQGSTNFLSKGTVLGVATEITFVDSGPQFAVPAIDSLLRGLGFRLFDLEVSRFTRSSLTSPEEYDYVGAPSYRGQVIGADALYLRDAVAELGATDSRSTWTDESILKLACLFELFGLPDCSIELLFEAKSRSYLANENVNALADLATPSFMGVNVTYREYLARLERVKALKSKGHKSGLPLTDIAREDSKAILGMLWNDIKVAADRWLPRPMKALVKRGLARIARAG